MSNNSGWLNWLNIIYLFEENPMSYPNSENIPFQALPKYNF